ncbi:MAG: FAD-dependent oxidoreductase [Cyanobacteria bacterium]|nr:FAD-dependent oxidoreductase [Cyanobacteriota bacterium]
MPPLTPQTPPRPAHPHICIIGGGFGGLYTALYLARKGRGRQPCDITLVEPSDRFTFTPLLYEVLTDELKPWEIAPRYGDLLQGTAIHHRQTAAQGWDLQARTVTLATGEVLTYDYLVIATGSQQRPVPVPGVQNHAYRFRTWADADALEARLAQLEAVAPPPIRVTVVGGGPSGVEVACKLADRLGQRGQVQLVEQGDRVLKPFSPRMQRVATRALVKRRVTLRFETGVQVITADALTLTTATGTETTPMDLVVWAAGTRPTPWLGGDPATTPLGQQAIRPSLQLPGQPYVFVVGDQAAMPWRRDRPAPQTAQAAYQAAATVAHNLLAVMQGRSPKAFRYLHLGDMMTLGDRDALVSSFGLLIQGRFAAFIRQVVYLQRLPTWGHRLQVARHRLTHLGIWFRRNPG